MALRRRRGRLPGHPTGARPGERSRLRAIAAVLSRLLAELSHVDRRRLLSGDGPVLRRAREGRWAARLAAGRWSTGDGLSPHFTRAYLFGAFALLDAGGRGSATRSCRRGFKENPDDWHYPAYLGFFAYTLRWGEDKARIAAEWYQKAAAIPGRPDYIQRLAAALLAKGGERQKAILMWGQVYVAGDKYARQKAVDGLEHILPKTRRRG